MTFSIENTFCFCPSSAFFNSKTLHQHSYKSSQ
jgi:hypothetical protein